MAGQTLAGKRAAICCHPAAPGAGAGGRALASCSDHVLGGVEHQNSLRRGLSVSTAGTGKLAAPAMPSQKSRAHPLLLSRHPFTPQVSHDLRELAPLVDAAWEMRPGGRLEASSPDRLPML